jgi:SAM-dependent methyltransferase
MTTELLDPTHPAYRGQADYTPGFLAVYDPLVLHFANSVVWRCPGREILRLYDENVAGRHLDVGPGTGWFLKRCRFPVTLPSITLLDANPHVLRTAAQRLAWYGPATHQANLLEPIDLPPASFGSIGLTHVLHCLPGTMADKAVVFDHLRPLLAPGGRLFGTTILRRGVPHTPFSLALLRFLNLRGVFGNAQDDLATLEQALAARFDDYTIRTRGSVAVFSARVR